MDAYFTRMQDILREDLPSRIKFMLQDAIELRADHVRLTPCFNFMDVVKSFLDLNACDNTACDAAVAPASRRRAGPPQNPGHPPGRFSREGFAFYFVSMCTFATATVTTPLIIFKAT